MTDEVQFRYELKRQSSGALAIEPAVLPTRAGSLLRLRTPPPAENSNDAEAKVPENPAIGDHEAKDAIEQRLGEEQLNEFEENAEPPADPDPTPHLSMFHVVRAVNLLARVVRSRRAGSDLPPEEARRVALKKSKESFAFFASLSAAQACRSLFVDPKQGLSTAEADKRLIEHGPNELPKESGTPLWKLILEQFSSLLVILLVAASLMSLGLGDYEGAAAILVVVIFNAILGVIQESRAEAALEALESLAAPTTSVIRNGLHLEIPSRTVVPGDVVILETGKGISADMRLIESQELQIGEMALTGEPEGVAKDARWIGQREGKRRANSFSGAAELNHQSNPLPFRVPISATTSVGALPSTQPPGRLPPSFIGAYTPAPLSPFAGKTVTPRDMSDIGSSASGSAAILPLRSVLTSSSLQPQHKKEEALTEKNMAYTGCIVLDGRGKGVVVKTGLQTKVGEIAKLLKSADKGASPLQVKLSKLGTKLGIAAIVGSVLVFVIGISAERGTDPVDENPTWLQMLLVAVSLTVAVAPQTIPVCVTITLALGMRRMVAKNALVRNLRSVETLGSATIVCSDKTGTLTKGEMTAVRLWSCGQTFKVSGIGYSPEGHILPITEALSDEDARRIYNLPLLYGLMASNATLQKNPSTDAWEVKGAMTERLIVVAAKKAGMDRDSLSAYMRRVKENPFNSARKTASFVYNCESAPSNWLSNHCIEWSSPSLSGTGTRIHKSASAADVRPSLRLPRPGKAEALEIDDPQVPVIADVPQALLAPGGDRKLVAAVTGAPNVVIQKCTRVLWGNPPQLRDMDDDIVSHIFGVVDAFSSQALRVIAVAYRPLEDYFHYESEFLPKDIEKGLTFVGLFASIDPERPEVPPSIEKAFHAGVRCVMITGDYVKTAKAIAENIGLLDRNSDPKKAIDCQIIRELGVEADALAEQIEAAAPADRAHLIARRDETYRKLDEITLFADVYARAKPVDKITIVRSLQRQGHICSMTGDGVNDAPALKQANIGVAMGLTGTDVAKAAADIVLTDDNFVSIVEAVEQGRVIYSNIQKCVYYLLSTNFPLVGVILSLVIIGAPTPLKAIQILFLNLATDALPAISLAMEPAEPGVMNEDPRLPTDPLLDRLLLTGIAIQAPVVVGLSIITFLTGLHWELDSWVGSRGTTLTDSEYSVGLKDAQTMLVLFLVFQMLFRAETARSLRLSVFQQGFRSNMYLVWSIIGSAALVVFVALTPGVQDVLHLAPIAVEKWAWAVCLALVPPMVEEIAKYFYRRTGFGRKKGIAHPYYRKAAALLPSSVVVELGNGSGGGERELPAIAEEGPQISRNNSVTVEMLQLNNASYTSNALHQTP